MQITVDIPDALVSQVSADYDSISQTLIQDAAVGAYCRHAISEYDLQQILGIDSRYQMDAFLKELGVERGAYSGQDLRDDLETLGFPLPVKRAG